MATASQTRRRALLALLLAAFIGFAFTPAADDDASEDEAPQSQPRPEPNPYNTPPEHQPFFGDDGRCPFAPDFCKEHMLYETRSGGRDAPPSTGSGGASGPPATLPGATAKA